MMHTSIEKERSWVHLGKAISFLLLALEACISMRMIRKVL